MAPGSSFAFYGILLALDALVDLFTMHGDIFRGIHSESDLISLDPEHGDGYFVADHKGLAYAARKDQHDFILL